MSASDETEQLGGDDSGGPSRTEGPAHADDASGAPTEELGAPPADAPLIDRRYRTLRVLGEGGHGKVLLVEDTLQKGQKLALKLLKTQHLASGDLLARFRNEIVVLRALSHPGIPQIYNDGLTESGEFYFTMAYVEGETLATLIRRDAPLAPDRIVRLTRQILEVLDYAHKQGAVHRDLKPGNIFVIDAGKPTERVKVLDFGIAKLLSHEGVLEHAVTMNTEVAIGTPHYMAPEQVRNQEVDQRTDMYALGIIIYQMCSGRLPFQGTTALELLAARLENPPTPLGAGDAPQWLRDLVMQMLQREREKRPDTKAVREVLERLARDQKRTTRNVKWLAGAVAVLAVAVFGLWRAFRGSETPATAATAWLELRAPPKVWQGQAFSIGLEVELREGAAPDVTLELPWLDGFDGVERVSGPGPREGSEQRSFALAGGGEIATEKSRSFVRDGATYESWSLSRRFVAARAGSLVIPVSRLAAGGDSATQEQRVEVTALPEQGRPADFGGAIGRFEVSASLGPRQVRLGDSARFVLHVRGDGNQERILLPELAKRADFAALGVIGTGSTALWDDLQLELALTPTREGTFTLAAVELPAFDPSSGRYVTLRTEPLTLVVDAQAPVVLDRDGDGTPDAVDGCPDDPNKTAPGLCGCGKPETDTDGDGSPDCVDLCPNDPNKTAPGVCGCGKPDVDSDGDGLLDCVDPWPNDPLNGAGGAAEKPETFAWEQLLPEDGSKLAADARTVEVRGRATLALRSVTVNGVRGEVATDDGRAFVASVPLEFADASGAQGEVALEIVAIDANEVEHRERRKLVRDALRLPRGLAFAREWKRGFAGLPSRLVHEATGLELVQVSGDERSARYVSRTEVSWDQYERGGGAKVAAPAWLASLPERGSHPVVNVSFDEASDFCRRNALVLPSAADLERAARPEGDSRRYPWGDEWRADACNWKEGDFPQTAPCGRHAADRSWSDVLDLAGNVREWCVDAAGERTLRGGATDSDAKGCEIGFVPRILPDRKESVGFRVALVLEN
jgi:formylglycine-generating enzyme required for sulfatase activity/tRNA A-37 threonylcarbamoyl transferase component Bud32